MSRPITIAKMEERVRWQADMLNAQLRNTSEEVRRAINQSAQAFREKFSWDGDPYYLKSYVGVMAGGQHTIDDVAVPWGAIDISGLDPPVVRIMGIDLIVSGIRNIALDHITFAERNDRQGVWRAFGVPDSFFTYDENTIGMVPAPQAPYQYILWYLPLLPELMADDDEINPGVPGAEEWIVLDVCEMLMARDNNPRQVAVFANQKERRWTEIQRSAGKRQRVGPARRLDTRSRRMNKQWLVRFGGGHR